jgi:KDO2-lipid IV(A) lauroyltransferase
MSVQHLLGTYTGWENMVEAANQKRGVLILTPHLGNWEFGGPWLTQRGVDLHVITLEEPGEGLTSFRREARARWQIKTVVIGNDLFGFVQIIRLLESGATIALLMDRPLPPSSTLVQLFGQPFPASVAAAELARASGCALLPVYVVREGQSYTAHILPQITYERATLRDRATRQALTQRIMTTFEPVIQQHPDQWYHFVPVWPKAGAKAASPRTEAGQTPPG